jgi:outer membrane lipoprotein LolB
VSGSALRAALFMATYAIGLAGCQSLPTRSDAKDALHRPANDGRLLATSALTAWAMHGRIAVSDGKDGGSGRLDWRQNGEHFDVQLSAPVTRRSWRLRGDAHWVLLEGLEEGPLEGPDAEQLLRQAVGWDLPIRFLVDWMRGLQAPGRFDGVWDERGFPTRIQQGEWVIEYRDWFDELTPPLPRKIFAQSGEHRVRLVVERWDVAP